MISYLTRLRLAKLCIVRPLSILYNLYIFVQVLKLWFLALLDIYSM